MITILIRNATPEDQRILVDLERRAFGIRAWPNEAIGASLHEPFTHVYLAEQSNNGQPVGFMVWRQIADEGEILSIGVIKQARGQHIGRQLLAIFEQTARKKNLTRLVLDVDSENPAALALYRACGYQRVGLRPHYYKDGADAIIMAKRLLV